MMNVRVLDCLSTPDGCVRKVKVWVFLDTIDIISVKLCMVHLLILLSMTFISSRSWWQETVDTESETCASQ